MSLYVETSKINHCSNLNEKIITDNKKFSKTVTQFFTDKVLSTKWLTLIENDKIINNKVRQPI